MRWGLRGSGKGERLGKVKVLLEVLNLRAGEGMYVCAARLERGECKRVSVHVIKEDLI